ncbi:MAG: hypothetical protein JXO22_02270, partial [Phycisphaerae bacterium]|nr:hypothetical protein [Phycisphaerae bacterium]
LPRAQLRLSGSAPIVLEGREATVIVDAPNSGDQTLHVKLEVTDENGRRRHGVNFDIAPQALAPVECKLPALGPGVYEAHLVLLTNGQHLLERRLSFAVLKDLEGVVAARPDIGVDLVPNRIHDVPAARDLFHYLECGAVRVGVPMVGDLDTAGELAYFQELSALLRSLTARQIDLSGIILAPGAFHHLGRADSTRGMLDRNPNWRENMSPVLAQQIGGLISTWQVGAERLEIPAQPWTPEMLSAVRTHLARFVGLPRLVVPMSLLAPRDDIETAISYWLPPEVPTRSLARQLGPLVEEHSQPRWLFVDADQEAGTSHADRLMDLGRRVALCKSLGPDRVILPAPLQPALESGSSSWQPTDTYVALRTLCHYLSGRRCVGVINLDYDGLALIFDGPPGSCIVAWTWRSEPQKEPIGLYLGDDVVAVDLLGRREELAIEEGRSQVYLTPTPVILSDVDASLVLLQDSVSVTPTSVEIRTRATRPLFRLRNTYDQTLVVQVDFLVPDRWQIEPATLSLEVPPGAPHEVPLDLVVPRRELAAQQPLTIRLQISSPTVADLVFDVPVRVGLQNVDVRVDARWEGDALIVTQVLHNQTDKPVSFAAFCQAPLRPLIERAFANVQPDETQTNTYVLADQRVRELAGLSLHLGLREYRGERELDQLVEVPR